MSQTRETVTEKRTVIKSSAGHLDDLDDSINFKSSISPRRSNVIQRSSFGPGIRSSTGGSGGTVYTRTVEYGYGSSLGSSMAPGGFEHVSKTGVSTVKNEREKEKKDMQELNERFANYIEKVRFLEAQNRKLASELETLRDKWGKETSAVKKMYESELAEARKLIDDLQREKSNLEIKNQSLQEQMQDMQRQLDDAKRYRQIDRETIDKLNQQLSDAEAEINLLRRTVSSLEADRARDRDRINQLQADVDKLRIDLNNETLNHLDAENRRQTLEEEIEFLKKVHEQELKELAALAYRDTTEENREFWKSELAQAIRDIQKEYDSKVDQIRGDMEGFYNLKIQEFRTGATKQNMEVTHVKEENKKLVKTMSDLKGRLADLEARNAQLEKQYQDLLREYESIESEHTLETSRLKEEITSLRAEMENILQELQTIMDTKLSLELEIAAYRKLLESEESRYVRGIVSSVAAFRKPSPWSAQRMQPEELQKEPEPDEQPQGLPDPVPVPEVQSEPEVEPEPEVRSEAEKETDDEKTEADITPDEEMIRPAEENKSEFSPVETKKMPDVVDDEQVAGVTSTEDEKAEDKPSSENKKEDEKVEEVAGTVNKKVEETINKEETSEVQTTLKTEEKEEAEEKEKEPGDDGAPPSDEENERSKGDEKETNENKVEANDDDGKGVKTDNVGSNEGEGARQTEHQTQNEPSSEDKTEEDQSNAKETSGDKKGDEQGEDKVEEGSGHEEASTEAQSDTAGNPSEAKDETGESVQEDRRDVLVDEKGDGEEKPQEKASEEKPQEKASEGNKTHHAKDNDTENTPEGESVENAKADCDEKPNEKEDEKESTLVEKGEDTENKSENDTQKVNGKTEASHKDDKGDGMVNAHTDDIAENEAEDPEEDSSMSVKMMRGEVSAKTTYQRTSTGPISISDVSPEGKYISLENTSSGANRREVNLEGWKLKRTVDGKRDYIYSFRNVILKPGKSIKVFARGAAAEAGMNDLIFRDEETWGVGSQVTTSLLNEKGEDKATHTQKTHYN